MWNLCVIIVKNDGSPVVRTPLENSLLMLVLLPYCPTNTACHAKLEGSPPCQGGSESSTLLVTGLRDQTLCRYNHYIVLLVHNTKVYIEIPQMNTTVSTSQVWLRLLKAVLDRPLHSQDEEGRDAKEWLQHLESHGPSDQDTPVLYSPVGEGGTHGCHGV